MSEFSPVPDGLEVTTTKIAELETNQPLSEDDVIWIGDVVDNLSSIQVKDVPIRPSVLRIAEDHDPVYAYSLLKGQIDKIRASSSSENKLPLEEMAELAGILEQHSELKDSLLQELSTELQRKQYEGSSQLLYNNGVRIRTAIALKGIAPDKAQEIIDPIINGINNSDEAADFVMRELADSDPLRCLAIFKNTPKLHTWRRYGSTGIIKTINSCISHGYTEEAFAIVEKLRELDLKGVTSKLASVDPARVGTLIEGYYSDPYYKKAGWYSSAIEGCIDSNPEAAIKFKDSLTDLINNVGIDNMYYGNVLALSLPTLAKLDKDTALTLLSGYEQRQKDRSNFVDPDLYYNLVIAIADTDPETAERLMDSASKNVEAHSEIDANVQLILAEFKNGRTEKAEEYLDTFLKKKMSLNRKFFGGFLIQLKHLHQLSEVFPEKVLDKIKQSPRSLTDSYEERDDDGRTIPTDVFSRQVGQQLQDIIKRSGYVTLQAQKKLLDSILLSHQHLNLHEVRSVLLTSYKDLQEKDLLDVTNIFEYIESSTAEPLDLRKIVNSGLLPESDLSEALENNNIIDAKVAVLKLVGTIESDSSDGLNIQKINQIFELLKKDLPSEVSHFLNKVLLNSNFAEAIYTITVDTNATGYIYNLKTYNNELSTIADRAILKMTYNAGYIKPDDDNELHKTLDSLNQDEILSNSVRESVCSYIGKELIKSNIEDSPTSSISTLLNRYNVTDYDMFMSNMPAFTKGLPSKDDFKSIEQFLTFIDKNQNYLSYLQKTPDISPQLLKEDLENGTKHFSLIELEELKRAGVSIIDLKADKDYKNAFEKLTEVDSRWQDQVIVKPFRDGSEIFGYTQMFRYINRDDVTKHDALHAFGSVVTLYQSVSDSLTPQQFYGNILSQVRADDREYDMGTSYDQLNSIVSTLNINFQETFNKLQKYKDLDLLKDLSTVFSEPQAIFASWNNLKRYSDLTQLLERAEILDELVELNSTGQEALYQYVSKLSFHRDSKVDMPAVLQFWRKPEEFLAKAATHTPEDVHNSKKPSNYIHIPNLDLTAAELRDALVEGKMDKLQTFTPMEAIYNLTIVDGNVCCSTRELVKAALGSRKAGIVGKAKDSKKLFSELNNLLKTQGSTLQNYLVGETESNEGSLDEQISKLLFDQNFGIPASDYEKQTFVAKINKKSDPDGVLAGNDTACCMPFGDGKNTVYTFNLNTATFTLQLQKLDGTARTIAQSVITKDRDIGIPIPEVLRQMSQQGALHEIIPQTLLQTNQAILACDNVEVSHNYNTPTYTQAIERIYADFFKEYLAKYGQSQRLDQTKVIIGVGYSDSLRHLPEIANTFAPQAPVSYSDKTEDNVLLLELDKYAPIEGTEVKFRESEISVQSQSVTGIQYLTHEDSLAVGYLEGKIYQDNQSLIQNLHNMENALIAKDINNGAKNRPNMSFKYIDDTGRMRGYVLAYEGKIRKDTYSDGENDDDDYEYDDGRDQDTRQSVIYIADLASDRESAIPGGRLIQGLVDAYKVNYLQNGNLMPIYMEARENTSYRIIQRQLERIGRELNITFEVEEFGERHVEEDIMHSVLIRPRSLATLPN